MIFVVIVVILQQKMANRIKLSYVDIYRDWGALRRGRQWVTPAVEYAVYAISDVMCSAVWELPDGCTVSYNDDIMWYGLPAVVVTIDGEPWLSCGNQSVKLYFVSKL